MDKILGIVMVVLFVFGAVGKALESPYAGGWEHEDDEGYSLEEDEWLD